MRALAFGAAASFGCGGVRPLFITAACAGGPDGSVIMSGSGGTAGLVCRSCTSTCMGFTISASAGGSTRPRLMLCLINKAELPNNTCVINWHLSLDLTTDGARQVGSIDKRGYVTYQVSCIDELPMINSLASMGCVVFSDTHCAIDEMSAIWPLALHG